MVAKELNTWLIQAFETCSPDSHVKKNIVYHGLYSETKSSELVCQKMMVSIFVTSWWVNKGDVNLETLIVIIGQWIRKLKQ